MKKIIGFLIVLGVLVLGAPQAKAYTLDDLMAQITSLQQQVSGLQNEMSAATLKAITPTAIPVATTACLPTTFPSIKIISPNGGENYNMGGIIKIKWSSCNLDLGNIQIRLRDNRYSTEIGFGEIPIAGAYTSNSITSSGSYDFIVNSNNLGTLSNNNIGGNYYSIIISASYGPNNIPGGPSFVYDISDNLFKINSGNIVTPPIKNTTTTSPTLTKTPTLTPAKTSTTTATKLIIDQAAKNVFQKICIFQRVAGLYKADDSFGCGSAFGPLTTQLLKKYYKSFVPSQSFIDGDNTVMLTYQQCQGLAALVPGSQCVEISPGDFVLH